MSNENKINRREFIKDAAIVGAAAAAAGALGPVTATPTVAQGPEKLPFEVPPPPIAAKDIKETITTDVVVVGAGNAGMVAAISAAQAGAKTVLIQKTASYTMQAGYTAAIGSRLQKALNIRIDRNEAVLDICRWGGYHVDQRVVRVWADKSGEVIDWLRDILEAGGLLTWLETDLKDGVQYKQWPVCHRFSTPKDPKTGTSLTGAPAYMPVLEKKAKAVGVDIRYETPGVQLIRQGKGRVTGIIAKNKDGDYIQFNVNKAVILCAGGYQGSGEMLKAYCPRAYNYSVSGGMPDRTGDGIKMGLWVGAAMDDLPHAPMQFDSGLAGPKGAGWPWSGGSSFWRQPFLHVNLLGERYAEEDGTYQFNCNTGASQPGHVWWKVWDENWPDDIRRFHTTICSRLLPSPMAYVGMATSRDMMNMEAEQDAKIDALRKQIQGLVDGKFVKKANTIDELAALMNVPVAAFKATVARYNELARLDKDLDFGKASFRLSTLEKPPFYAAKYGANLLSTMSGLKINTKMQVLDTEFSVIPGLYAAGDNSGSFFANDYPQFFGGLACGRTFTFARLAALNAAAEKVV